MRLNRMVDQRQRLRDLMSEVQENHTDIQRLWKAIEAGGIVWPVGIAAAPPIEEMSSSSSQSSSPASSLTSSSESGLIPCDGCDIPITLTAVLSGTWEPSPGDVEDYPWNGTYVLPHISSDFWTSPCTTPTAGSGKMIVKYNCDSDGGVFQPVIHFLGDCSDVGTPLTITRESFTCDPFHWVGTLTGGSANLDLTLEVTE
jgi:hypothetical protein